MFKKVALLFLLMLCATFVWSYGEAVSERVPIRAINPTTYVTDFIQDGADSSVVTPPQGLTPVLAFSDMVSGPDIGLGDGLGSGVIVTVWGYHLGSTQGTNTIEFCDAASVCRTPAHIYYWKNANGVAPSGPANLYESHGIQEIAFSIPDSASGLGSIKITTDDGESNPLPFTVRAGNIYHVSPTGNDTNPGTFAAPWQNASKVGNTSNNPVAPAGSTVYFHGVTAGGINTTSSNRGMYFNNALATAPDAITNFFLISYPGAHSTFSGQEGFSNYRVDGTAISKFRIESSNCTEIANGQRTGCLSGNGTWGIQTDKWGRVVGNYLTDQPGRCSSGAQGSILGDASFGDNVSNSKIYGNEIEEYGCNSSNALHHTTYLSIRSNPDNLQVEPWEFGWNYLHDNDTKSGIHNFDQNRSGYAAGCGDATGPVLIRNNVVVNQAGPGIYVGSQCEWEMDFIIENNIVINAGLPHSWDGLNPDTSTQNEPGGIVIRDSYSNSSSTNGLLGTMYVRNNLVYGVGWQGMSYRGEGCLMLGGDGDTVTIDMTENICYNTRDYGFIGVPTVSEPQLDNFVGSRNIFYFAGTGTPTRAIPPSFDTSRIILNPLLTINGPIVTVDQNSPARNVSTTTLPLDIYGIHRSVTSNIGPVQSHVSYEPPAFGPQSSTKGQEWGFDFVETFDGLQDWNQSALGRVGDQYDTNSTGLPRMPKLANGDTSAWGYFSLWGNGTVSTSSWIGGAESGARQVWRGTKSAAIDLGETAKGPSRLGLFMEEGYSHISVFYMAWIPVNAFPTSCEGGSCSGGGPIGTYDENSSYSYYGSYKFNDIVMGCPSSNCPDYGEHVFVNQIKWSNYAPVGHQIIFDPQGSEIWGATDAGVDSTLTGKLGGWFGFEINVENINNNTQSRTNIWIYDQNGNSSHILRDRLSAIPVNAQATTWNQFVMGGNNANSWEWGPTMSSHYYVDDFIVDHGSKGRIGPRYFAQILE